MAAGAAVMGGNGDLGARSRFLKGSPCRGRFRAQPRSSAAFSSRSNRVSS
jgi:hypothetical protein